MLQIFFTQRAPRGHSKNTWELDEHSKGTKRALGHSRHSGTEPLVHWKHVDTQSLEHFRHSGTQRPLGNSGTHGTWELRYSRHSSTWALEAPYLADFLGTY